MTKGIHNRRVTYFAGHYHVNAISIPPGEGNYAFGYHQTWTPGVTRDGNLAWWMGELAASDPQTMRRIKP